MAYYKFSTCAGFVQHNPMMSYLSHTAHTIVYREILATVLI